MGQWLKMLAINSKAKYTAQMRRLADTLYRITLMLCIALFTVMFAGQIIIVVLRYVMHVGFLELQDAVIYAFSCLVVLTIPLAFHRNRHVRVDIFRTGQSDRVRAIVDRAGHLLFTLPVFLLIALDAWPLVSASWKIAEGSRETGGLPGLFLVKSMLLVMCLLIIVQGVTELLAGPEHEDDAGERE